MTGLASPATPWTPSLRLWWTRRIAQLLVGLVLYGLALALMVRAGIGLSPWDVLAQGVSLRTGLSFGLVVNLVGAGVLLLWIAVRERPGVGTLVNVLLIGPSADLGLWLIPPITEPLEQVVVFAGGMALLAFATALYLGARLGSGPRDGLMTGLHRRTGWPVWVVRTGIEVVVVAVGWLLGGQVGVGTVAFALLIGPMIGVALGPLRLPERPGGTQAATGAPDGTGASAPGSAAATPSDPTAPREGVST